MTMQDPAAIEVQKNQAADANNPAMAPGTGEMANLNRRQLQNNQKAITDFLQSMIAGDMSEARVRVGLSSLGLSSGNIDLLIKDALDGTIDTDLSGRRST